MTVYQAGLDPVLTALAIDPRRGLSIVEAGRLASAHHPPFAPDSGALLLDLQSGEPAAQVQRVLLNQYPRHHPLELLVQAGGELRVEPVQLNDLSRSQPTFEAVALFIPPLPAASSFEALQETVAHLRAPEGCPWDREQTHRSLRKHLLEEAYEALEALDNDDLAALQEELGDLLLQILLQAQIASESGAFNAADVVAGIQAKLVRRHPHVFGDLELTDVEQVLKNWEHFKEVEKGSGVLDGVPHSLPALAQAEELQGRAARVGFDWPRIEGVLVKVEEQLAEIQATGDPAQQSDELGDVLFAIVNYARWIGVDPEAALRGSNRRFRRRFSSMNQSARAAGLQLDQMGIEQLERLWEAAKRDSD